jgi:magnesium transporter
MKREIFSGLSLGVILGIIGFIRISIWQLFGGIYGPHWLSIAFVVTLSLIGLSCGGHWLGQCFHCF